MIRRFLPLAILALSGCGDESQTADYKRWEAERQITIKACIDRGGVPVQRRVGSQHGLQVSTGAQAMRRFLILLAFAALLVLSERRWIEQRVAVRNCEAKR